MYYHHCKYKFSFFDRVLFDWVSLNQKRSNHNTQSKEMKISREANKNPEEKKRVHCLKRGKTQATKSRLVLVLHQIGWETGARFLSRPITVRSKAKPKNTKLPIALFGYYTTFTFSYRSIAHYYNSPIAHLKLKALDCDHLWFPRHLKTTLLFWA